MSGPLRSIGEAKRWARLRDRLAEAQNHRCAYCGVRFGAEFKWWTASLTAATIDHIIPRSREGTDAWENLVAACFRCNQKRGDEDAWTFFARKGWLSNRDRKLGHWLDRAIRKAEPLAPSIAARRKRARKLKRWEIIDKRAEEGSGFALARRAHFTVQGRKGGRELGRPAPSTDLG